MLFIRMQGWRGGMERWVSTNRCGWNGYPPPQVPPSLRWGTQQQRGTGASLAASQGLSS